MTTLTAPSTANGGATPTSRPARPWRETAKPLAFALAALVAVAVGWGALSGGDQAPSPAPPTIAYADRALGLRLGHPPGWRLERRGPARRVISPDGAIAIVFGSPTPGAFVRQVRRDTERTLLRAYRPSRLVARAPGRLGNRRVITSELVATSRSGRPIRILSMAAASRWRTYAVAVISASPPPAARFLEAQQILRSVSFTRPVKRR